MRRVGLAVAVGDATPEVKHAAHFVTAAIGGKGAARELVELILKSKGIWEEMIEKARACGRLNMHAWHDVSPGADLPRAFHAVIAIPLGSNLTYGLDRSAALLRC